MHDEKKKPQAKSAASLKRARTAPDSMVRSTVDTLFLMGGDLNTLIPIDFHGNLCWRGLLLVWMHKTFGCARPGLCRVLQTALMVEQVVNVVVSMIQLVVNRQFRVYSGICCVQVLGLFSERAWVNWGTMPWSPKDGYPVKTKFS